VAKGSIVLLALGAVMLASECPAADFALRGIALGDSPPAQACVGGIQLEPAPCFTAFDSYSFSRGWLPSQIGGLPELEGVSRTVGVTVREGKVEQVELYFAPHGYESMLEALTHKFGRPISTELKQFQTPQGRTLSGRSARWDLGNGAAFLELDQHRPGSDQWGYATLTSRRHLDALRQRRTEDVKQLKNGL
jgi:hypothetical protein